MLHVVRRSGAPVLLVAPHATAPLGPATGFVQADSEVQTQFAAHVAEWHDAGSAEVLEACGVALGATTARAGLPRGLLDLNRGWRGRVEEQETLFGKGAVDGWVGERLRPGALGELEGMYRRAMAQLRQAARGTRGIVDLHSYGELGSTYDQRNGGRPVRRAAVAIVDSVPWRTARPVGLARLIPGDLRGLPWPLHRLLGEELATAGLALGPHPYPSQAPWTLSGRYLAERWFQWLAATGRLPDATAERLGELAWSDEQHADLDAAAGGAAVQDLEGVAELAKITQAWDAQASQLAEQFLAETGAFATTVELRLDLVGQAEAVGAAVARAVAQHLAT
ncbi:MAG: hypothetical protein HY902_13245 [Deltaproteobacteria bacterium]|nr:hypothetical protein [Deltaproteobacteria bacterium]